MLPSPPSDLDQPTPAPSQDPFDAPAQPLKALTLPGLTAFFLVGGLAYFLLRPSLGAPAWDALLDAFMVQPATSAARILARGLALLALIPAVSLVLPWLWEGAPVGPARAGLMLAPLLTCGMLGAAAGESGGLGGTLGGLLFAGFGGLLLGGILSAFMPLDRPRSSLAAVAFLSGVVGMFALAGLMGYLVETFPQTLGWLSHFVGLSSLAMGGLAGGVVGGVLFGTVLNREGADRAFKALLCTLGAASAFRILAVVVPFAFAG